MGNTTSYPIGQIASGSGQDRRALTAPSQTTLAKLQDAPIESPYMRRLIADTDMYFKKMRAVSEVQLWVPKQQVPLVPVFAPPGSFIEVTIKLHIAGEPMSNSQTQKPAGHLDPKPQNMQDGVLCLLWVVMLNYSLYNAIFENFDNLAESTMSQIQILSQKNISILREMKRGLIEYNRELEKVLLRYSTYGNYSDKDLPSFESITHKKKKVLDLIKRIKPEQLPKLLPNVVNVTPDDVLCSIVGLDSDHVEYLSTKSAEHRSHLPDIYWIKEKLHLKADDQETIPEEHNTNGAEAKGTGNNMKSQFLQMGFTDNRSELLTEWVQACDFWDHQPPLYWANAYLDYMFNYDILLNDASRFPYEGKPGVWLTKQVDTEDRVNDDDAVPEKWPVKYINCPDGNFDIRDGQRYPPTEDDENCVLFHGTVHRSAVDIVENGIKLQYGGKKMDFSDGNGFYLTKEFQVAKDFADAKGYKKSGAIIVYKVPKDTLSTFEQLNLSEKHNKKMFHDIVHYFRGGSQNKDKPPRDTIRAYKRADYVEGHMSRDTPDRTQFCIKSEKMAEAFGDIRNINGVIFL